MTDTYIHNSQHKNFIRDKWCEFASEIIDPEAGMKVITFPAEEMHDLRLFAQKGLFSWEETETGSYYITKGKIVCFEKSTKLFIPLSNKLSNATVEQFEIGAYLRNKYESIMKGNTKIFPVDVINLDYDGNISKNKVPIQEIINHVFEFQALHKKSFSLFMTWPHSEDEDEEAYKTLLKTTIDENLTDPRAQSFKDLFEASYNEVKALNYDQLSIIGLSKIIIKKASHHRFHLNRNEFYQYGEEKRRAMYSILLNFEFQGDTAEHSLYSDCVSKSLTNVINLADNPSEDDVN